ncbi:MAG: hypothetical protein PHE55_02510 [Methylococcaceae bacterium]|nr:hypothetical protein [Methylococcaceae bacterium]
MVLGTDRAGWESAIASFLASLAAKKYFPKTALIHYPYAWRGDDQPVNPIPALLSRRSARPRAQPKGYFRPFPVARKIGTEWVEALSRVMSEDRVRKIMYTLGQAARATGKTKSTIFRAIQLGRISIYKDSQGRCRIQPVDLHRVYGPVAEEPLQSTDSAEETAITGELRELRERVESLNQLIGSRRDGKVDAADRQVGSQEAEPERMAEVPGLKQPLASPGNDGHGRRRHRRKRHRSSSPITAAIFSKYPRLRRHLWFLLLAMIFGAAIVKYIVAFVANPPAEQ